MFPLSVTVFVPVSIVPVTPVLMAIALATVPVTPACKVAPPVKVAVPMPSALAFPKFNVPALSVVPPL